MHLVENDCALWLKLDIKVLKKHNVIAVSILSLQAIDFIPDS